MRFISVSKSVIIAIVVIAAIAVLYAKQRQNAGENTASPTVVSQTAGTPRLLDLGATQCVPCKMMQPVLAGLEKEYAGRLQVEFIDVWKDRAAGQKYGIEAIPTQICYDASGKEVFRHIGFYSKDQILAAFRNKGIALEARK